MLALWLNGLLCLLSNICDAYYINRRPKSSGMERGSVALLVDGRLMSPTRLREGTRCQDLRRHIHGAFSQDQVKTVCSKIKFKVLFTRVHLVI